MIAVVARKPVAAAPYLKELAAQSLRGVFAPHQDGYGAAIFNNGHWLHVREQCPVWLGALDALGAASGTILLLHSRKASDPSTVNVTKLHPFCAPVRGAELMFCMNGTIQRHDKLSCGASGCGIDTEKYFDLVKQRVETGAGLDQSVLGAVEDIERAQAEPTSLNCFLSDGRELVAYKGKILTRNVCYHTLFVRDKGGVAVISTEPFRKNASEWTPLEGIFRRAGG
jgi:predicted glutamine amidotransferase